ncbi:polysaccharide biosynthesis tyrosine autokinase [Ornithinimicrobium cavernae]|uniref:polysaccharide biosynthesis tyrosine autokinase n=1 Tax=Ornithinimicrobium cavernae TaxID=2666047 RepID=UPI00137B6CF8|nr:polysaccharide biosynthesis tyrosine autokinase [Ornithinimicrobium cavernae]
MAPLIDDHTLGTEMELGDFVRVARRNWRLVLSTLLLVVAVSAIITASATRQYQAETELFVSTSGADSVADLAQGGSFTQRQVTTYADLVSTPLVLEPVISDLGLDYSTRGLARHISASVPPNTVLIRVTVTDENPSQAAEIANAISTQFAETIQSLERVDSSGDTPVKATVVRPATIPQTPASPDPVRNIAIATVLGLLLGSGLAMLRDLSDKRVRGESDISAITDEPIIGAVTFDADATTHPLVVELDPRSMRSESFRSLRTNLIYLDPDNRPRVLLTTSSVMGEGKSTTATNLALTIAETGSTVCLIEGDLRRPRVMTYMGLENAVGLTEILVGRAEVEDVMQPYVTNMRVIGCGQIPPNPSELLGSNAMKQLIERLSNEFDYVIIDGPPLMAVTDSAILSTIADGTIVVVGTGIVDRDELQRTLVDLDRVGGKVVGLVANRLPVKGPDAYRQAYGAYQDAIELDDKRRPRRARPRRSRAASTATRG